MGKSLGESTIGPLGPLRLRHPKNDVPRMTHLYSEARMIWDDDPSGWLDINQLLVEDVCA